MSRLPKILLLTIVIVFALACNFVTQPIKDAQNLAQTAQALGTAIPIQTLEALPSMIPSVVSAQTLEALPSVAPTLEAFATNIGNVMNPQGPPVQEWKGIPVMPQATVGQEFTENNTNIYSFKANVKGQEVQDFYKEKMTALGWNQTAMPGGSDSAIMVFDKDSNNLVITIIPSDNSVTVLLALT